MNCPFCAEEIKDQATVCKHCGRDLSIARAIYVEIRALTEQVTALQRQVEDLRAGQARVARARSSEEAHSPDQEAQRATRTVEWFFFLAPPFLLLMTIHYLVVFVWDAPLSYLFVSSIAVPLVAAVVYCIAFRPSISRGVSMAIFLGLAAVLAMLYMTMSLDPHHPKALITDVWELREATQYFATITLSSISGCFLAAMFGHVGEHPSFPPPVLLGLAAAIASVFVKAERLEQHARTVQTIVQAGSTLATSATAVWMGVEVFFK